MPPYFLDFELENSLKCEDDALSKDEIQEAYKKAFDKVKEEGVSLEPAEKHKE